jgi:dolichol-phosphate mannosyltransferase
MSVIVVIPVLDEEAKIGTVLQRVPPSAVDEILVVDDGSADDSAAIARRAGATVLSMGRTVGVGAALRAGFRYALDQGYDVIVVMAGNNKDSPEEIPRLVAPVAAGRADFVQGSRFLESGGYGHMPLYRRIATRIHPLLFTLLSGRQVTESTNGFRAIHRRVLEDERLDLSAARLDRYELEPYLYLRAIRLGNRTMEVPVTKIYPPRALGQTKMRPVTDWWSILRPLLWAAAWKRDPEEPRR